jgi:G patch domain-containing protein 2
LGFRGCSNEEVELEEATLVTPRKPKEKPKGKRNEGFLSIGGIRIYTEDISSPESGVGDSDEESESDYEGRDGNDDGDSDEEGVIHQLMMRLLPITWRGSAGVRSC